MMKCASQKRIYYTRQDAVMALLDARTRFDYAEGHGPIAIYQCEDCGHFHLTSKGVMDETLAAHLESGKIRRQKEADRWTNKIKNQKGF
jgi:hypothetical protein